MHSAGAHIELIGGMDSCSMADLERCKRLATLRKRAERDREDINKKNAVKEKDKERKKWQRLNESNLENTQKQLFDEELPEQKYVPWYSWFGTS